jgi:hypothetical protein
MITHPPPNILQPGSGIELSIVPDGRLTANIANLGGVWALAGQGLYASGRGPAIVLRNAGPFAVTPAVDNVLQWTTTTRIDTPGFTLTSANTIIGFTNPLPWPVTLVYSLSVRYAAAGGGLSIYRLCKANWDDLGMFTTGDYAPSTGSQFDAVQEDHVCLFGTRTVAVGQAVQATFFAYQDETISINSQGCDAAITVLQEQI